MLLLLAGIQRIGQDVIAGRRVLFLAGRLLGCRYCLCFVRVFPQRGELRTC